MAHQPVSRGPAAIPGFTIPAGTFTPGTKVQVGSQRVIIEKYLSEGGFAHVYLVRLPKPIDGVEKAVLKRVAVPDKEALASMRTEVETMKKLKGHKHIVTYMDSHASSLKNGGFEVFLLMEYCSGGGLIDFMNTRLQNRLTEPEILKIFADVCHGVASMHYLKPPLLHRDLKVENVLILNTGSSKQFKLCDFGSTAPPRPAATNAAEGRLIEEDVQKHTTIQYRSPEMIDVYRKQPIDEKSDIWALGVLLYKLCYYTTPFEEQGRMAILNATYRYPAYPIFSDKLKLLIAQMLQEKPQNRPNIYLVVSQVCKMRGTQVPIKDIYVGRTASEARRNEQLPSPPPDMPQVTVGATRVALVEQKLAIPEITPMRRGRPTTAGGTVASHSPSPGRPNSADPFTALDSKNAVASGVTDLDEVSARFPALDQFSLLHESEGPVSFGSKDSVRAKTQQASQPRDISLRVAEVLADDAFARPKPTTSGAKSTQQGIQATLPIMRTTIGTQTAPEKDALETQYVSRPKQSNMVSIGTMTSPVEERQTPTPSRHVFRVTQQERTVNIPRRSEISKTEPASDKRSRLPNRPSLSEHRSLSQLNTKPSPVSPSLRPSDYQDSGYMPAEGIARSRSTNSRSRPISASLGKAATFLRGGSPSAPKVSTLESRPDRTSAMFADHNFDIGVEPANIDSSVDFLKSKEEEPKSRKDKRMSSGNLGGSRHIKRASMPSISLSNTKSLFAGRFGDAFKRFESGGGGGWNGSDDLAPTITGDTSLTPIAGSEATDGRSDDGDILEETLDVPPAVRRELERRRLSQEERRVTDAAAAYKLQVATNGTGRGGGGGGQSNRASAIQSKVQALLDESGQRSPTRTKKTAEGYGRYTAEAQPREEDTRRVSQLALLPQQSSQASAQAAVPLPDSPRVPANASAPPAAERAFARPSAPPKPQVLRTGGSAGAPIPSPKPGHLAKAGSTALSQTTFADDGRRGNEGGPAVDKDWEVEFTKKYPSLGKLEMVETEIDSGRA